MKKEVSLSEFVEAFADGESHKSLIGEEYFVWKDLGCDLDELEWFTMRLASSKGWKFDMYADLSNNLPYEAAIWTTAWWKPGMYPDLKLREFYAFCRPHVDIS